MDFETEGVGSEWMRSESDWIGSDLDWVEVSWTGYDASDCDPHMML